MNIQTFDYSVDLLQSILWQYNNATNIQSLLTQKQSWYDVNQTEFWSEWYSNVFNLVTANQFGLAVWAIILGLPLFAPAIPNDPDKPIFGFNAVVSFPTYLNSYLNFNNSNFATVNDVTQLTIEEQRFVLRLRYFQLSDRGDITDINSFLNYLCLSTPIAGFGKIWALDGFNMTMTYVFNFDISIPLREVLVRYDLLPRPAGVGINYVVLTGTIWGFNQVTSFPIDENSNQNFSNGNFIPNFI